MHKIYSSILQIVVLLNLLLLSFTTLAQGTSCSTLVPAQEGANVTPNTSEYYYFSFTMPRDGKIVITSNVYREVTIWKGCGSGTSYGSNTTNLSSLPIAAGTNVSIVWRVVNAGSFNWNLSVADLTTGDACTKAAVALEGNNQLPEIYNYTYFYSFTMPRAGKLAISYESTNANVWVYSGECNSLTFHGYGTNKITVTNIAPGTKVSIRFQRGGRDEFTGNFPWSLAILDYQEGDLCRLAKEAPVGANQLQSENYEYWYKYTIPTEGGKLLISSESYYRVYVYRGSCEKGLNIVDHQQFGLTLFNLPAGEVVYIRWQLSNEKSFSWNLAFQNIAEGDLCNKPKEAVEGTNTISTLGNRDYWYTYQVPKKGKLVLSTPRWSGVYVYRGTCGNLSLVQSKTSSLHLAEVEEGEQLVIKWSLPYVNNETFIWELSVADYTTGDICSMAAVANENLNTVPSAPYWYKYTMPLGGNLKLSTTGLTNSDTKVQVFRECGVQEFLINDDTPNNRQSEIQINALMPNETIYFKWDNKYNTGGFEFVMWRETTKAQTVTFDPITDQSVAAGSINLNASASTGLPITYYAEGPATISGNKLSFTAGGRVTVKARQNGNEEYHAAEISQTICVNPSKPTVTLKYEPTAVLRIVLTSSLEGDHQWYLNGNPIEGATTQSLEAAEIGLYTVQAVPGGCNSQVSDPVDITLTTGVRESAFSKATEVFPNPTVGKVQIALPTATKMDRLSVQAISASGTHFNVPFELENEKPILVVNLQHLPAGLYKILIRDGEQRIQTSIIKQ